MNDRVKIDIFRFTAWSGEVLDPEMDVRSDEQMIGNFTWRSSQQESPRAFDVIRFNATFVELADIDALALDIRGFFTWEIREEESVRIATNLVAKISHAMAATTPGEPLAYTHSEHYFEQLLAAARRPQYQ
ncbi:MAG: hypothetical protein ACREGE_02440 [Candidatus Microsaccharimonas sp.]